MLPLKYRQCKTLTSASFNPFDTMQATDSATVWQKMVTRKPS